MDLNGMSHFQAGFVCGIATSQDAIATGILGRGTYTQDTQAFLKCEYVSMYYNIKYILFQYKQQVSTLKDHPMQFYVILI